MKKIVLVLLVVVGVGLIGVGAWWIFSHTSKSLITQDKPLQELQEIGRKQPQRADSVIFSTPTGVQLMSVNSGEVASLAGSFDKLLDPVQQMTQSADGNFWIIMTQAAETQKRHWYLVNWQKDTLQRLDESLEKMIGNADKTVSQVVIGENAMAVLRITDKTQSAETTDTTEYALATLALDSLKYQNFGTVTTQSLKILGYDAAQNEVIFTHITAETQKISGKRFNSNQNYDLIDTAEVQFMGPRQKVVRMAGDTYELASISSQTPIATLLPKSGHSFEPTIVWSADGKVFATIQYSNTAITEKIITFYSDTGVELYALTLPGSQAIHFSPSGEAAAIISTRADETGHSEASTSYHFIKIYEGTSQVFSNIPTGSQLLGVL